MKKALITGISGQDGSYLAELLVTKGYKVHGFVFESELADPENKLFRLQAILDQVELYPIGLQDFQPINDAIRDIQPDECYHLAAQSVVSYSQQSEFSTINTNINGTHNILAALKMNAPECKLFFASSSEVFGRVTSSPQDENTPFNPRSVYGVTKLAGLFLVRNYRSIHKLFACNGVMYNHESERRGFEFVTRKISAGAASIKLGLAQNLRLGNIEARRDWGYAPDYVQAMWLMLQQEDSDDYVVGTGETHSVKDFLEIAFGELDLDWQKYVEVDPEIYRPVEPVELRADPKKACEVLGWKPQVGFTEIVQRMVRADYECLKREAGH